MGYSPWGRKESDTTERQHGMEGMGASLVAQLVKNLPTMQETPVQFLGQEYPLKKG